MYNIIPATSSPSPASALAWSASSTSEQTRDGASVQRFFHSLSSTVDTQTLNLKLTHPARAPFIMCDSAGNEVRPRSCLMNATDVHACHINKAGDTLRSVIALGSSFVLAVPNFTCQTHRCSFNLLNKSLAALYSAMHGEYLFSYSLI
jgi:hypothetical protein